MSFNDIIHKERSKLLANIPKGASTVLSAGCSGKWYFDWFEEHYGRVDKHIGLELYTPRPTDLPDNVEWIENSVENMSSVLPGSIDLVFSGQNVEHLSPEVLLGFLQESNRVLRRGGLLVIDSPNRSITQGKYIQPEHVFEFTPDEVRILLQEAGFVVENMYGILLCREKNGIELPLTDTIDPKFLSRITHAKNNVSDSFIWWIEAKKVGHGSASLPAKTYELFLQNIPGFVSCRFKTQIGRFFSLSGTETTISADASLKGYLLFGPYLPLFPGHYQVIFRVCTESLSGHLVFDAISAGGSVIHAARQINARELEIGIWTSIILEFSLDQYITGFESRIYSDGADVILRYRAEIFKLY